jgi:hypothetical protein
VGCQGYRAKLVLGREEEYKKGFQILIQGMRFKAKF